MIALIQRVLNASVTVEQHLIGSIQQGILVFVGVEKQDTPAQADRLLERVLGYRIFTDSEGKMNVSVRDCGGGVLLVPQFTLAADTQRGMRPSFTPAAAPEQGRELFYYFCEQAEKAYPHHIEIGEFGADMKVSLINDGPVTFWLKV